MRANRRHFLRHSAGLLGTAGLVGPLAFLRTKTSARAAETGLNGTRGPSPYGPLFPVKDQATKLELLMLPRGFSYSSFSWKGDALADGNIVPGGHDGMAVVSASGARGRDLFLIRNHEVFGVGNPTIAPDHNYDGQGGGGTTALLWRDGKLMHSNVSISGTISNCAGGKSPWGTWLTCEEGTDQGDQPHGYVFECTTDRVTDPTPLVAMGRFSHEAISFDPRSGTVYLTEDNSASGPVENGRARGQSGFYRFVPQSALGGLGSLEAGGRLFMAKAIDRESGEAVSDLRNPTALKVFDVEWVEITAPDTPPVGSAAGPYLEGRSQGATRFQRLEGCWWSATENVVYFVDTEGGPIGAERGATDRAEGAVWRFDPDTQTLTAIFVSQGALVPSAYGSDNPDNVTVSPRGGLLLCEDGGKNDGNGLSLLGLSPSGQSYEFCRNNVVVNPADGARLAAAGHDPDAIGTGDFTGQEFAGATFDPSGQYLFVNIQTPGITFVIKGPWSRGNL